MSAKEIAEQDKERGGKFIDPEDTYTDDDHPKEKKPWLTKTPVNKAGEKDMNGTDILKSYLSKSSMNEMDDCADMKKMAYKNADLEIDDLELDDSELEVEDAKKALSTSSFHIPRPAGGYDKFDIMRSATTVTTRKHSGLNGPEGVAPLVGETLSDVADKEIVRTRTKQPIYKSCSFHGLTHRTSTGCVMCGSINKSSACKGCGDDMYKVAGGGLACKACE